MGKLVRDSKIDFQKAAELILLSTKNNTTYGMVGLNLEGQIQFFNLGAEAITGYSEAEMLGKPVCTFFTREDVEAGVPDAELRRALRENTADDKRWHVRKNGDRFWAEGAMTLICDDSGRKIGLCKIFHDDTVRKTTEDEIIRANAELARFAHVTAHDLQQPLRTITIYLQLLQRKNAQTLDAESQDLIRQALKGAAEMKELVDTTLTMAQNTAASHSFEIVDMAAVVDTVCANLKSEIDGMKAVITRRPLPVVIAIPSQISRVVQNLIANALKFHRPETTPRVEINAEEKAIEWVFSIRDNGIGIASEDKERVFDFFTRLQSSEQVEGAGLGLGISRRIVDQHGGRMWVDSEQGTGSTFHFTIPKKRPFSK